MRLPFFVVGLRRKAEPSSADSESRAFASRLQSLAEASPESPGDGLGAASRPPCYEGGMKCHSVALLCLVGLPGCSSSDAVEGTILSQSLRETEGETAEAVKVFVVAAGVVEQLSVRVTWAFQVEQSDSIHPFGAIDVAVEQNGIGASTLACETAQPELAKLLNGDQLWMTRLSCSYSAEGQSGEEVSASLWANGLLTHD